MELPQQPQPTSPLKAIRSYCLSCCLESALEVKLCPAEECPLWAFRFGKNPYRKSTPMSDEQKKERAERLRRFKHSESAEILEENNMIAFSSIKSHLSMENEETSLNHGEYPTYGNFPEEDHHG